MADQIQTDKFRFDQAQSQDGQQQTQDNTILHPEKANSLGNGSLGEASGGGAGTSVGGNGLGGETAGLDSIAGIQGQTSPDTELQGSGDTSYNNARADLREDALPAEGVSPDTGTAVAPDMLYKTPADEAGDSQANDIQQDAANAVMGGSSDVVQDPHEGAPNDSTPFRIETEEVPDEEAEDDPLAQEGTFEGKKVFRPNELNQAGEDKEYFPPKKNHQYEVPADVQHHALRPDLTLKPGATKPEIELKNKQ